MARHRKRTPEKNVRSTGQTQAVAAGKKPVEPTRIRTRINWLTVPHCDRAARVSKRTLTLTITTTMKTFNEKKICAMKEMQPAISRKPLFKTGRCLIRYARYFILQLAESHLTPTLFRQIVGRIERLTWHPT